METVKIVGLPLRVNIHGHVESELVRHLVFDDLDVSAVSEWTVTAPLTVEVLELSTDTLVLTLPPSPQMDTAWALYGDDAAYAGGRLLVDMATRRGTTTPTLTVVDPDA